MDDKDTGARRAAEAALEWAGINERRPDIDPQIARQLNIESLAAIIERETGADVLRVLCETCLDYLHGWDDCTGRARTELIASLEAALANREPAP